MEELRKLSGGIGLAANQIGVMRRVIVCLNDQTGESYEFINPRLISADTSPENLYWSVEGCMSHPGCQAEVARMRTINFAAYRMRTGKIEGKFTASGLLARVIQHELDHINGLLYTDLGSAVRNFTLDTKGQELLIVEEQKAQEFGLPDEGTD